MIITKGSLDVRHVCMKPLYQKEIWTEKQKLI